ncbi:MAG: flagellar hook-length control protein FliK [Gammaproteobacteria bacterium]|nr:flagellar hook-length control protein FliK [Gammaproteobacteria bacterium]
MDIKSLSDSLTSRPPVSQAGDLLAQLKAAGTIEAEVIKVLQNKLLLSSRLGDILTSNSLNYKVGDQLNLRLGGSKQSPVLKASPKQAGPVTLASDQNLRLSRALPSGQPVLAVVTRIVAQRIEIRLAEQILTLPRQPGIARDQLISLKQNNANRTIEITPVDRKMIYKALLKQLVPRQSDPGPTSLVKLLNLVNKAVIAPATRTVPVTSLAQNPANSESAVAESRPMKTVALKQALPNTDRAPAVAKPEIPASSIVTKAMKISPTVITGTEKAQAENNTAATANSRQINALLRQINKSGNKSVDPVSVVKPVVSESISKTAAASPAIYSNTPGATTNDRVNAGAIAASSENLRPAAVAAESDRPTIESRVMAADRQPVTRSQTPQSQVNISPAGNPSAAATAPTTLQMLLQWVPRLAEMNVTQIKQWFEFANLIRRPKAQSDMTAMIDPVRSLNKLLGETSFSRELTDTIQIKLKAAAGEDAPKAKTLAQDILQQYVRDGVKLVEQSLSQNLLQRASLGLQQETQQPLSLSLVLPFLEKQEVKPIQIDLSQRGKASQDNDNGWDIRLSFEFEGLGPIACHLFLEDQALSASFYSDQDQTRNLIDQALPELEQQLLNAGFTNCEFHSFPGATANTPPPARTGYSESLIDIEA